TDEVQIEGNARVFRDGTVFTGPSLRFFVDAARGEMPQASFSYAPRQGRGRAQLIEFLDRDRVRAEQAIYTACAPGDDAWWVRTNRLEIDRAEELAVARGATLYFQGVPILASPYLQFPLGDRRRSGLLTPGFAINSALGAEVTVPYYWDIAPNRDLTIAPRVMSRRGVLLQNEFRFLEPTLRGRIGYDNLPRDTATGTMRDNLSVRAEYANFSGVTAGLNFNRVSDDRFFADFGRTIVSAAQAVLPQEAFVAYHRPYVSGALRVSRNQTLQDPLAPIVKPYERVPQLTLSSSRYDWYGADVALNVETTRFVHPTLENGQRTIVNPVLSYPLVAPGWFVVPKLQWHYTAYVLDGSLHPDDRRPRRSLPLASLDTGLVFEREGRIFFGAPSVQTLEPRLYYAYVPYRDQSRLPNFDSALADFNFAQLFTEQIFVGGDRIGEANQLTAALVGRVFDPASGAERLRAAIGQRYYFSSQRVTLPGGAPREDTESDLLFALSGSLARHWVADVALQHSTLQKQIVRLSAALRWQPAPASVVSAAYRYKIDELRQVDLAAQWPLSARLYGVARANYSLRDQRWVETLGGFEYKADCWLLRIVGQRFVTTTQTATTSVFLQLELNGLASVGTSPVEQLRRNIPGYQVINPPPRQPGRYDVYE
ncbi:MAG: LPS-assembly protein LptD, partial [Sutterellaceae bacterium]|nr:LPS-assembly protein LptD [Burkholderiaceae bacterium]MDW8430004.1 LPS-assembly protein LptD [Sutterellaceae bacterium]